MEVPIEAPDRNSQGSSECQDAFRHDIAVQGAFEPTFRDPAGQLRLTQTHALRRIHLSAVDQTLAFLRSPLRAALERSGDLIPTEVAGPEAMSSVIAGLDVEPGELWLQHPRINPISYPWEW